MNTKMCTECMYNVKIIEKSKSGEQMRSYCNLAKRPVRTVLFCPEGYDFSEYERFLAKCEEYDEWATEQEEKYKNSDLKLKVR